MAADVPAHQEGLLERILVKGEDFDQDGVITNKKVLFRMEGLFKLTDIRDRIPIENDRLKYWHSNAASPFNECFVKVTLGEKRHMVFVDLVALNKKLREQMEQSATSWD